MRISRLLLSGAAVGTMIGTGMADFNDTHVTNPNWPAHARFHAIAGWGTIAGSQLLGLWLLWRPARKEEMDLAVRTAAALSALAWLPFFAAAATPGAEVEDEPGELPRVAGVPLNLVPASLIPALSGVGYALHRQGY